MESITLGQIAIGVTFLVGLISGVGFLLKTMKDWISKSLDAQLHSIKEEIKGLHDRIDDVDMESCKNFLVRFLSDVEKDQPLDEVEKLRFHEQYAHYVNMGGNSYIRDKVEKLKASGKL